MPTRNWSNQKDMTVKNAAGTTVTFASPDSPARVTVDTATGMVTRVEATDGYGIVSQDVTMGVVAVVGGIERRDPTGGLTYDDTVLWSDIQVTGSLAPVHRGVCHEFRQSATLGEMDVTLHYRLFPTSPFVEIAATLSSDEGVLVRNLEVALTVTAAPEAIVNAPGNMLHRNTPLSVVGTKNLGVSPIGGLRGSSGLVCVTDSGVTSSMWPNNPTEIADIIIRQGNTGLDAAISLNFAADINPANEAEVRLLTLDVQRGDFEKIRAEWPEWAARYHLTSPANPPAWIHGAGIYEVQIGTSHFWNDNTYCRYEEIKDLIADLDRVQGLGFSIIQLMPRQPYPSYNVHDYDDITVSYGDEQELSELVARCHHRGMHVILDVLLHGVLDNESIDSAANGVLNGPLADRLDEEVLDTFGADVSDSSNYWIAWSRHILDFAPHWRAGSPKRTPLQQEHPDWFATDSDGNVSGVYTKAFDARNPEWQRYFRESMLELIRRTDADGFRFDAPTYNFFANWAPWARSRAFMSPLGCVPLFIDMRNDLKALKPDALMYTEPSGHLLRRSMDMNYNYDEQWLVAALLGNTPKDSRGVRNARDFMRWMQDRDDFLPVGSQTAHHIDSHDTFWWPQWGKKWRREQFSMAAVRALAAAFLTLDGPYMMFTGGEEGMEDVLSGALGLRKEHAHLWASRAQFDTTSDPSGDLVIAHRSGGTTELVCIVNLSGDEREIPEAYVTGWNAQVATGVDGQQLAGYGIYWVTRG